MLMHCRLTSHGLWSMSCSKYVTTPNLCLAYVCAFGCKDMMEPLSPLFSTYPLLTVFMPAALFLLLLLVKRIILVHVNNKAQTSDRSRYRFYRVFGRALSLPLSILSAAIITWSCKTMLVWAGWLPTTVLVYFDYTVSVLLVVTLFSFIERFSTYSIKEYKGGSSLIQNSSSILSGAIRIVLVLLTLLFILSALGISITPVLASLGIGSLAVALALQPTLENFFSGIQLVIDKPVRIGDYIELDSGEQGFVEKIGWRSTWIRMLPNNVVIIPNSKLSNSKLINYFYPEPELSVPVEVGVHYNSDLEQVELICLDVAKTILKTHPYGVATYDPFVVFHTFDSSSINLTVMLRTREYFNRFFIKSAFMKLLKRRFDEAGIVIPFPITALNMQQENAGKAFNDAFSGRPTDAVDLPKSD